MIKAIVEVKSPIIIQVSYRMILHVEYDSKCVEKLVLLVAKNLLTSIRSSKWMYVPSTSHFLLSGNLYRSRKSLSFPFTGSMDRWIEWYPINNYNKSWTML